MKNYIANPVILQQVNFISAKTPYQSEKLIEVSLNLVRGGIRKHETQVNKNLKNPLSCALMVHHLNFQEGKFHFIK